MYSFSSIGVGDGVVFRHFSALAIASFFGVLAMASFLTFFDVFSAFFDVFLASFRR